jgi:hypothetical protein
MSWDSEMVSSDFFSFSFARSRVSGRRIRKGFVSEETVQNTVAGGGGGVGGNSVDNSVSHIVIST